MIDDEGEGRAKFPVLVELQREDLERFSRDELAERIRLLEREKTRTEAALSAKGAQRSAADILFKK